LAAGTAGRRRSSCWRWVAWRTRTPWLRAGGVGWRDGAAGLPGCGCCVYSAEDGQKRWEVPLQAALHVWWKEEAPIIPRRDDRPTSPAALGPFPRKLRRRRLSREAPGFCQHFGLTSGEMDVSRRACRLCRDVECHTNIRYRSGVSPGPQRSGPSKGRVLRGGGGCPVLRRSAVRPGYHTAAHCPQRRARSARYFLLHEISA
jgi:hypothetical protein